MNAGRQVFAATPPPEPGREVAEVTDKDGDIWRRQEDAFEPVRWQHGGVKFPWDELVRRYGPVTDSTPRPAIKITTEMAVTYDQARREAIRSGRLHAEAQRLGIVAALKSAGYDAS